MIGNYLRVILRNYRKHKYYTILNILGLSIGLAMVFLITLYLRHELTYDCFNKKANRIFRIIAHTKRLDWHTPNTSYLLTETLRNEYPEIEKTCRTRIIAADIDNNNTMESIRLNCVDPEIFDIFSLNFLYGTKENALTEPHDLVISETRAKEYFPNENPVGETIKISINEEEIFFKIKGVIKDTPSNSTLYTGFLVNIENAKKFFNFIWMRYSNMEYEEAWYNSFYGTYILLKEGIDVTHMLSKINEIPEKHHDEGMNTSYYLQNIKDIYFHSGTFTNNGTREGNISNIYLFAGIALLILFIACTNFILLSTAQSLLRTKEVAMRKILGAHRVNLTKQIIFESIFITSVASSLGVSFAHLMLPTFKKYLNAPLEINYLDNIFYLLSLLGLTIFVGVLSGSYLSFFITRLNPIKILQKKSLISNSKSFFRKAVIAIQMIIFIGLLSSSIIINNQVIYLKNKELGFSKEYLVKIDLNNNDYSDHYDTFINEINKNPNVILASGAFGVPPNTSRTVGKEALYDNPDEQIEVQYNSVYYDFFETLGIELDEGRIFSKDFTTDSTEAIILNETAVRELHINNPLGKTIQDKTIIGVIKDYHDVSLYDKISPIIFTICPKKQISEIVIRITSHQVPETIDFIKQKFMSLQKDNKIDFNYSFIDEDFSKLYWETEDFSKAINSSTIIAIVVACLGLFGLTMFTTNRKSKEIGIRKVFGASPYRILKHLSIEIIVINLFSTLISVPIVILLTNKWLENFPYKISISYWEFLLSGLGALILSLLTMSIFSVKASLANPVNSIKDE